MQTLESYDVLLERSNLSTQAFEEVDFFNARAALSIAIPIHPPPTQLLPEQTTVRLNNILLFIFARFHVPVLDVFPLSLC